MGAEIALSGANISGSSDADCFGGAAAITVLGFGPNNASECEVDLNWLITGLARAGYAQDQWMIYGAAGWALAGLDYRTELTSVIPVFGTFSSAGSTQDVADGLAIGGGFEYAINESMSIGAQYLRHYLESEGDGFGSQALGPFFANLQTTFSSAAKRDVDLDLVSARLNIRLNSQD